MSAPHKAKILIVDDESLTCFLLQEYFEGRYHVETACNGSEALRKVNEFQPDCMLLDIRMPDMDGIEVLKTVKPLLSEVKVIMVTAIGCADIAKECLRLGAFDYTVKPIDLDVLENQIQSALAEGSRVKGEIIPFCNRNDHNMTIIHRGHRWTPRKPR